MTDDHATPYWLRQFFENWFDPCPLRPKFDGLRVRWQDPTFANIPYSDPELWVEKAIYESYHGVRVILLTRVDPSTKWWLKLVAANARVTTFFGRIKFTGNGSPNFASALWFLPSWKID